MTDLFESYSRIINDARTDYRVEADMMADHFQRILVPTLRQMGLDLATASICEIGAGWGRNVLALERLGARHVQGFDVSRDQVEVGRRLGCTSLRLINPGETLRSVCGGQRFDLLLAIDVLEHFTLEQLGTVAAEISEALNPGGVLVVRVPNDLAPINPVRAGDLTHQRAFTATSVVQFFRLCGMETILLRGTMFPGSGWAHGLRRILARALLFPLLRVVSRVLYGRIDRYGIYEANIFGIARKT